MSFLSQPSSTSTYGLVKVGANIFVSDDTNINGAGIISIGQDVSTTATVSFARVIGTSITAGVFTATTATITTLSVGTESVSGNLTVGGSASAASLFDSGNRVITSFTAVAGTGLSGGGVITGTTGTFAFTNTGVLSLTAGTGITLSTSTGNITVAANGTTAINTVLTTSSYTVLTTDEYIGVNSTAAVSITLPDATGISGRTYIVKDERGQGSGKITVTGTAGQFPEASGNYIISVPYQSLTVVARGALWHII